MGVNHIFSKLYSMVTTQAQRVDTFERNVEITYDNVDQATKDLEKAEILKKKISKNRCCLVTVILSIIIIASLIIYFSCKK